MKRTAFILLDLLHLCRLYYALPMALAYLLTVYYACGGQMQDRWAGAAYSTVALTCVIAAAYVLNDVADRHIDRRTAPRRPLAKGRIPVALAASFGGALMIAGLVLGGMARPAFLGVLSTVAAGLAVYDLLSKRLGWLKQPLVAVLMTSIYPLAWAQAGGASGGRAQTLLVFPVWLFLTSFGYELLKDVRDHHGDPAIGGRPTPIQRRPGAWRAVAAGFIAGAAPLLFLPYLLGCGWVYLLGAALAMVLALLAPWVRIIYAIRLVYAECFLVGVAATLDVILLGM